MKEPEKNFSVSRAQAKHVFYGSVNPVHTSKDYLKKFKIYRQCGVATGHFPHRNKVVYKHTTLTEDLSSLHENTLRSSALVYIMICLQVHRALKG